MAQIGDPTLVVGDDVVLKVQGTSIGEAHRLRNVLGRLRSAEELTLAVLREGQLKELRMVVP
jgi:S1-C subfamily serine protease